VFGHTESASRVQHALVEWPKAIVITDPSGTIVFVNRSLEQQFGYAGGELVGQSIELILPEARQSIAAVEQGVTQAPPPPTLQTNRELAGRRKDGSAVAVEIDLSPFWTDGDLFVLVSVVPLDERRKSEHEQPSALEPQLEFERAIATLSYQFINLPTEDITAALRQGLGRMCELLHVDRGAIFKLAPDRTVVSSIPSEPPGGVADAEAPAMTCVPWAVERAMAGAMAIVPTIADVPSAADRDALHAHGTRSAVFAPLSVSGDAAYILGFDTVQHERTWPDSVLRQVTLLATVFSQVLARQQRDEAQRAASLEAQRLTKWLDAENVSLRQEERERLGLTRIIARSPVVRRVIEQIQQVAPTDSTVLLIGETGTGKELFATQIHELSPRRMRTMIRVNCAAIPATLIESELFGREKGAFTGALARQVGRFELADQSTIFLDEIGDLPLDVQVKLLRVLEEQTIERLGSPRPITVNTRIIAATHRNLEQRVAEGLFREDFYYRLNVFPIHVPPLRERPEDIPLLVWRFVEEFSRAFGKRIDSIDRDNFAALQQYPWPGNIRELRNVVERAMIAATTRRLMIPLPHATPAHTKRSPKLLDVEREHIRAVLEGTGWRIRGHGGAAERLGLKPTTLETRMAKLGLKRPGHG
jgi:formate hydrogenlyase transcriptional activator